MVLEYRQYLHPGRNGQTDSVCYRLEGDKGSIKGCDFLFFLLGCSQLPPGGFKDLHPPFQIISSPTHGRLPTAHTWYVHTLLGLLNKKCPMLCSLCVYDKYLSFFSSSSPHPLVHAVSTRSVFPAMTHLNSFNNH